MKDERCITDSSPLGFNCTWILIIIAIVIIFCCFCNDKKDDKKIGNQDYIF